nr:hypothetical protein [Legionella sainthelensi]
MRSHKVSEKWLLRAGLGVTAIQRSMILSDLDRLDEDFLPKLNDIHVFLLKMKEHNKGIESLEFFILKKLKH